MNCGRTDVVDVAVVHVMHTWLLLFVCLVLSFPELPAKAARTKSKPPLFSKLSLKPIPPSHDNNKAPFFFHEYFVLGPFIIGASYNPTYRPSQPTPATLLTQLNLLTLLSFLPRINNPKARENWTVTAQRE